MTTLLYKDDVFLEHETGSHPERPARLTRLWRELAELQLDERCVQRPCEPATAEQIALVHGPQYAEMVERTSREGGGRLDPDTVASGGSYDAAIRAVGAACDAVKRVVAGEAANAFCTVRPPGHHALPTRAMGFCLFNNVAIAAKSAVEVLGLERVLIVDWDVHHGNGTQDMFYDDGRVGFFSIHRWPFYPGTGDTNETGRGDGLGATRNLPVEFGTPRREYFDAFESELVDFAGKIKPQLVLVSAGFDAHRDDPVGSLGLESEDFARLTEIVQNVAGEHCSGKLVSLLEGGYDLEALAHSGATHLQRLIAAGEAGQVDNQEK